MPGTDIAALIEASRYRGDAVAWDAIVGHDAAKRELAIVAEQFRRPEVAAELGLTLVRGILIMGPPGTGKTMLAKALASTVERPAYVLPSAEMTPTSLRQVYERLADEPCVIIWDEIQSLIPRYDETRLVAAFCAAIDGVQPAGGPITIGLTADGEHNLDASALRAGRLTTKISIIEPDLDERRELWERAIARVRHQGAFDLDKIAQMTGDDTGADIDATTAVALGLSMVAGTDALTPDLLDEAIGRKHHVTEEADPPAVVPPDSQWPEAVHEAGHAAYAALTWGGSWVKSIHLMGTYGPDPRTFVDRAATGGQTRRGLTQWIEFSYAGMVGEALVLGTDEVTLGSEHDLREATRMLRELGFAAGAFDSVGPLSVDGLEVGRESDRGSERMRAAAWDELRAEAEEALSRVRACLEPWRTQIEALARTLHDHPMRTLVDADLAAALVPFAAERG